MGCFPSSAPVRVNNRKDIKRNNRVLENTSLLGDSSPLSSARKLNPRKIFTSITNGVHQITNPPDLIPLVCVGNDVLPIVTTTFQVEVLNSSLITLPVVICSWTKSGLLTCISSIDYLSPQFFNSLDASKLFNQIVKVSSLEKRSVGKALCVGFDKAEIKMFRNSFEAMSIYPEFKDLQQDISPETTVIINTRYELTDEDNEKLINHLNSGGSLIVFINQNEDIQNISSFLMQYGIGFTTLVPSQNARGSISTFENAVCNTFRYICSNFIKMMSKEEITAKELNSIVTSLRIYILACNDDNTDQLKEVLDKCWQFLHKTHYLVGDKFFRTEQQAIISTLVIELLQKLPLEFLTPIEGYEVFPGATDPDVELGEYSIELTVSSQEWTSTGLWVPAGVIAEVIIDDPVQNIYIQIGCHSEKLIDSLPWPRWPSATVVEPVVSDSTRFGSPFGGLVYAMISDGDEEEVSTATIKCQFKNCCLCPRFVTGSDVWESTKDIGVPWAEIETSNIIMTIPSKLIRQIDVNFVAEKIEKLIENIKDFNRISWDAKFRLVLDVMVDNKAQPMAYPIMFAIEDFDSLIKGLTEPNQIILDLLSSISQTMLQTIGLDDMTTTALSSVSTFSAITKEFPDFKIENINGEIPLLFNEFWEIHTKSGENIIPDTIHSFENSSVSQTEVPEDLWIIFVRRLSTISNIDFSSLLIKARPIPLSVINSLHSFQQYFNK